LPPPPGLRVDGAPLVPQQLAQEIAPYGEYSPTRFVAWHPLEQSMLILRRAAGVPQLFLLREPLGTPLQLTRGKDGVRSAVFDPKRGAYLIIARDQGGDEATQLFRLDLKTLEEKPLMVGPEQYTLGPWNASQDRVIVIARSLDRNGRRETPPAELYVLDPLDPESRVPIGTLPAAHWRLVRWLDREGRLIVSEPLSMTRSRLWVLDPLSGRRTELAEADGVEPRDGDPWLYRKRYDGDVARLVRIDLRTGEREWVTRSVEHEVDSWAVSRDGKRIAVLYNVEGRSLLQLLDRDLNPIAIPALPPGLVTSLSWHRNGRDLAVTIESADSPGEVYSIDVETKQLVRWTRHPRVPGAKRPFVEAEPIQWTSFDGTVITGFIHRPAAVPAINAASVRGKRRPVVIDVHGGPASQARPGFRGLINYWINEQGWAVIYPNVRGSSGFGRRFLDADNGPRREDALKDLGALLDWIAMQPDLDSTRVAVIGGSYGGYMALASAVRYGHRLAAVFSHSGISHFVTYLETTESHYRELRRAEYGDERDPVMRRFLDGISPLTHADAIRVPLMIAHGKNDPRVPVSEAEQIVRRVRANGTPVWYLLAEDEGHGFVKKANVDYQFALLTLFLERQFAQRSPTP
ncbi:MAG: alpha/beta fold hydrolase, partial [Burkholderiales bacterium]|nr:alpha/beta fold hydrolase [Burkholderiales bacterium]